MTGTKSIKPFLMPLEALQKLIERFNNRGVIIGGIASSLLGKPRLTADLDAMFLASVDDIPEIIAAAEKLGIIPRIEDASEFAKKNRVLLLRHAGSSVNIDISLGILPFEEEAVERSREVNVGGVSVRLPTPEDLVIFKAVAHRPVDLFDIQGIVESNPELDRQRIEYWVRQFSEALENPALWEDIARLL